MNATLLPPLLANALLLINSPTSPLIIHSTHRVLRRLRLFLPPQLPSINFATEWLDEDSNVCPKNVDYATQCPKGHALAPFVCSGGPQVQQPNHADDLICRVCHGSTQRQHACDWLVCSVAACCGGYAVCAACVTALGSARGAAAARPDDFCMMVMPLACELKQCLASSLL
jgi:hypothetical protein